MSNLSDSLHAAQAALGNRQAQLSRATNRYHNSRKRAYGAHLKLEKAWEKEHYYYEYKHPDVPKARYWEREANRWKVVQVRNHTRAQEALRDIKRLQRKLHDIRINIDEIEKKLGTVKIAGNHAIGGSDWDRWLAVTNKSVLNCSTGARRNFYSMYGTWDVDHVIIPGEEYGERSDCSSTIYGWIKAAGLPDPRGENFSGGYTGTLAYPHESSGWKEVSLSTFINTKAPGYIIYGSGTGHHTEAKCPSDTDAYRTAGHGSSPVDYGTTFLFGSNEYQRYYLYLP